MSTQSPRQHQSTAPAACADAVAMHLARTNWPFARLTPAQANAVDAAHKRAIERAQLAERQAVAPAPF